MHGRASEEQAAKQTLPHFDHASALHLLLLLFPLGSISDSTKKLLAFCLPVRTPRMHSTPRLALPSPAFPCVHFSENSPSFFFPPRMAQLTLIFCSHEILAVSFGAGGWRCLLPLCSQPSAWLCGVALLCPHAQPSKRCCCHPSCASP